MDKTSQESQVHCSQCKDFAVQCICMVSFFFLRKAYVWFLPVCSVNLGEEHFKCDKIIRWIRRKKKHVNLIAAVMLM
jgi:hypothetical protein